MSTTNQLTGGGFQDALGNALANGYLEMELSQDAVTSDSTQVASGYTIRINLDTDGNIITSPSQSVWPNDVLAPTGTFYNVSAFSSEGQLVWGPNAQQVFSTPSPFDIGSWIPGAVNIFGGTSGITLQTNDINNGSQTKLNLRASTNISLTDDGTGDISISATGGGGTGDVLLNPTTSQVITQPDGTVFGVSGASGLGIFEFSGTLLGAQTAAVQSGGTPAAITVNGSDSTNSQLKYASINISAPVFAISTTAFGIQPVFINTPQTLTLEIGNQSTTSSVFFIDANDTTGGNVSLTLPSSPNPTTDGTVSTIALEYIFKRVDSSTAHTVTINANAGQSIEDMPTYTLIGQWSYVCLLWLPSSMIWTIVGHS